MDNQNKPSIPNQSASDRPSTKKDSRKLTWFIVGLIAVITLLLLCILPGSPALGVFLKLPEKAPLVITRIEPIAFDPVGPSAGGPANVEFPVGSSITVNVPVDLTRPRPRPVGGRRTPDCIIMAIDNVTNFTTADPCPTSSTPKPPAPTPEPPVGFPKPKILDFGDAPDDSVDPSIDGHFPSLLSSNGARHINIKRFYLGKRVDLEKDSNQVDKDSPLIPPGLDDGTLYAFLNPIIGAGFGFSGFLVEIHNNDWPEENPIYLNGLYDTNFNKHWEAPEEHIIVDKEFHIPPGQSTWYLVPFITNIDFLHWLRLTVTDIPLGEGYDGSWLEAFAYGETEDYIKLILPPPPRSGVYHRQEDSQRVPPTDEPTYTPGSPGSANFDPYYWEQVIVPDGVSGLRALRDNLGFKAGAFVVVHGPALPGSAQISKSVYSVTLPAHGAITADNVSGLQKIGQILGFQLPDILGGQGITLSVRYHSNFVKAFTQLNARTGVRTIFQRIVETVFQPVPAPVPPPTPTTGGVATQYKIEVLSVNTSTGTTKIRATGFLDGNNEVVLTAYSKSGTKLDVRSVPFDVASIIFDYTAPAGAVSIQAQLVHNGNPVPGVIAAFPSVAVITGSGGGGGPVASTEPTCPTVSFVPNGPALTDGQNGRDYNQNIVATLSGGTLNTGVGSIQANLLPPEITTDISGTGPTITLNLSTAAFLGTGNYSFTFRVDPTTAGCANSDQPYTLTVTL